MAAQTCGVAQHATLSTTVADGITFATNDRRNFMIVNRSGSAALYYRFDGTTAVTDADDTYVCPSGQSVTHSDMPHAVGFVSVVGSGNAYSVQVF